MAAKKKSSPAKIIVIVIILLVVGAGAYFFLNKGKTSMMTTAGGIGSIKDALTHSVSMHCEYNEQGKMAKVDIKNGAIREDYSGSTPEETGSIIIKDKKMWLWNGKEGYIYDIPDDQGTTDSNGNSTGGSQKEDLMKSLEAYKDACKPGFVADSLFDAPADVTFTDIAKMQQGGAGGGAAQQQYQQNMMKQMQQQQPDNSQDNSGDNAPSDY